MKGGEGRIDDDKGSVNEGDKGDVREKTGK